MVVRIMDNSIYNVDSMINLIYNLNRNMLLNLPR